VAISGFGNVAWGAVEKVNQLGGKVVTLSGPDGYVYDASGISGEKIQYMLEMRASARDRVQDFADKFKVQFHAGKRPWEVKADVALPCATQNELDEKRRAAAGEERLHVRVRRGEHADHHRRHQRAAGGEGALLPGKASNAGGVATSGLEMSQNSMRLMWDKDEVDRRLHDIMRNIHRMCLATATSTACRELHVGANIAGFLKVADAMMDQGLV